MGEDDEEIRQREDVYSRQDQEGHPTVSSGQRECADATQRSACVIQHIEYAEPPAVMNEEDAADFARVQQDDYIQRMASSGALCLDFLLDDYGPLHREMIVGRLNHNTKEVRAELSKGETL